MSVRNQIHRRRDQRLDWKLIKGCRDDVKPTENGRKENGGKKNEGKLIRTPRQCRVYPSTCAQDRLIRLVDYISTFPVAIVLSFFDNQVDGATRPSVLASNKSFKMSGRINASTSELGDIETLAVETSAERIVASDTVLTPDGGYGWIYVAARFMINGFTWGVVAVSNSRSPNFGSLTAACALSFRRLIDVLPVRLRFSDWTIRFRSCNSSCDIEPRGSIWKAIDWLRERSIWSDRSSWLVNFRMQCLDICSMDTSRRLWCSVILSHSSVEQSWEYFGA